MTIKLTNLSKKYHTKKALNQLNIEIDKGEILGILGPNGAGKTTLMRLLMGYIKPTKGTCTILDLDCFLNATELSKQIGYLPGELSFNHKGKAIDYINYIASLKGIKNTNLIDELINYFEFNSSLKIKEMSKGTKQKLAIIICLMNNPKIYLLDEPTSGLDPIMQQKFIDYVLQEKNNGKTIIIASHIFEEIEKTCDQVVLLKDGNLFYSNRIHNIKNIFYNNYEIQFKTKKELDSFSKGKNCTINDTIVNIKSNNIDSLIKELSKYTILSFQSTPYHLEELFNTMLKEQN